MLLVLTLCGIHLASHRVHYRLASGRYNLIEAGAAQMLGFNMQRQYPIVMLSPDGMITQEGEIHSPTVRINQPRRRMLLTQERRPRI